MPDESTYGFNKDDGTSLIESIHNGEDWFPEIKPRGGGGRVGVRYVIFQITGERDGDSWPANFSDMDGGAIESGTLRDPLLIAFILGEGDKGYALYQEGSYWFVNAACPTPEEYL